MTALLQNYLFAQRTYDDALDGERLGAQLRKVRAYMASLPADAWRTLQEVSSATGAPEASASARLRDPRREGYTVERRRRGEVKRGLWEYRVVGGGR